MRTRRKNVTFGKNKNDFALPLACLLLNALVIPGTGTLIYGEKQLGLSQFFLWLVGVIFVLIGFPIAFAVWVWGIVSGIKLVQEYNKN